MVPAKEIMAAAPIAAVLSQLDIIFTLEEEKAALKAFLRAGCCSFASLATGLGKSYVRAAPRGAQPSGDADVSCCCGVVSLASLACESDSSPCRPPRLASPFQTVISSRWICWINPKGLHNIQSSPPGYTSTPPPLHFAIPASFNCTFLIITHLSFIFSTPDGWTLLPTLPGQLA